MSLEERGEREQITALRMATTFCLRTPKGSARTPLGQILILTNIGPISDIIVVKLNQGNYFSNKSILFFMKEIRTPTFWNGGKEIL